MRTLTEKRLPIPTIGIGGLIFNPEGKVLLIARKNPPRAGEWHIPGGRMEPGETLSECCRREVFEETGILATPRDIVAVADRRIDDFHYVIIDFLAVLDADSPKDPTSGSDALNAGWFSSQDIKELPLVDGLLEVIQAGNLIIEGKRSGLALDKRLSWLYA